MEKSPGVLIVDDDPSIRSMLSSLFEEEGFTTESFASGDTFLNSDLIGRRGCVILDANMPAMSGVEVCEIMRSRSHDIPIIFLSACLDTPTAVSLMKIGVVDVVQKPFDSDVLVKSVRHAIQHDAVVQERRGRVIGIRRRLARLTARETEVLQLVAGGLANKQIAFSLKISERTVETHRSRVMEKLDVESVQDLVRHYDAVFGTQPLKTSQRHAS